MELLGQIVYLIDQQASHTIQIRLKEKPSFQPLVIGEGSSGPAIELSREQALALSRQLVEACKGLRVYEGIEYPGKVIRIDGVEWEEEDDE